MSSNRTTLGYNHNQIKGVKTHWAINRMKQYTLTISLVIRVYIGVLVLSLCVFSSCKITKAYQRPSSMADSNLFREGFTSDTTTIAQISWKQLFTDTSLQALIDEGIQNNLDLKIATARIKAATANVKQSRLALWPTLLANSTATYQQVPPTQFGTPEAYQLWLSSGWELDIWGKLKSLKRASLAALLASEAYRRAVQTQLVANIALNYYLLLSYDAQLEITEKTVANRKAEVETMKILKESDVVTGAAVVQSTANRYSVEVTIPDLKQNIRETENSISLLLGRRSDTVFRTHLNDQRIVSGMQTGIPAQLLANRPDVQQAEYQLRFYFELANVARTYFYPSFTITATGGFSSTSLAQLLNPSSFFSNITGGLIQPIFNQGLNRQRLEISKANEEEFLADFRQTILTAGQEVSNALYNYQAASDKESLRAEQIAYLQKSVDYTKELLKYSSATNYTDVLTSEQSLLAAQLNSVSDKLQKLSAVVQLYRSLGGGWR
jgi:outer membrane protein, multidrug efflux system